MDQFPQMLYKAGGHEECHGGKFSLLTVHDAKALESALADGWHETTTEATLAEVDANIKALNAEIKPSEDAPPTRAELEQKAAELGLKFDGRTSDKKLAEAINAKI